ncbi:restriction endonuclease subunit S [Serratia fonticola]|uniref:restriction endonuclease subunit S n=1 Tax=Serratia fonticola TaxID=47917 RepID=UPI0024DEEB76|nr:restriction endonuclease subunit S [Serratia fonticola]MDK2374168.1 restriction endonuclease subunit S [Serratia fonticola]
MTVEKLITDHIDIWSSALQTRSTAGRGSNGKIDLYGIKKLRELILELAVRGKLVPQDPNDEPASELLKRIAAEKAELVKQGKIKKQKPLPEISEDEKPFELPVGWEWVRLGDMMGSIDAGWSPACSSEPSTNDNIWGVLKTTAIQKLEFRHFENKALPDNKLPKPQYEVVCGDILITRAGPKNRVGVSCLVEETRPKLMISDKIIRFHLISDCVLNKYVVLSLNCGPTFSYLEKAKSGMAESQMNISQENLKYAPVAIPPQRIQFEIVHKVEKLMWLCDQLEQKSLTSLEAHQQLVETLLTTLIDSQNAEELAENWARISQHFDTLFTTEASIDALKQTILQLAVMGKLVPQDPNDEPASELLKRIKQKKTQLVKEGKIKKQKTLPPISDDEKIFSIPKGWEWVRLDDICFGITSGSTPAKEIFNEVEGVPYLKVYNIKNQKIDFDHKPQFINERYNDEKMKRSTLYPGDVVMNIVGPPLGKVAIIPDTYDKWNCNQAIVFFRSIEKSIGDYIYVYLLAGMFLDSIELIGTAGQDNISVTKSRSIVLPFPPKNEQQKIKKMVEKMLHNCDTLKSRLQSAQQTQLHLADALTDAALN